MSEIKTAIGWSTPEKIFVRQSDLTRDLIGKIDFVDMIIYTSFGRMPAAGEKELINALLVTVTDHGLTPSAIAARLTYAGSPDSMQGAVAAGLLGAGDAFLGTMEASARLFSATTSTIDDDATEANLLELARTIVERHAAGRQRVPGYGHTIHAQTDPRVFVLEDLSRKHSVFKKSWRLAKAIERVFVEQDKSIRMNAGSAFGAIVSDLGYPPAFAKGLTLIARCAGLVAHVLEEQAEPLGVDIWNLVLQQDPRHGEPSKSGAAGRRPEE